MSHIKNKTKHHLQSQKPLSWIEKEKFLEYFFLMISNDLHACILIIGPTIHDCPINYSKKFKNKNKNKEIKNKKPYKQRHPHARLQRI